MTQRYKSHILQHIAQDDYKPQKVRELAHALDVPADHQPEFQATIEQLIDSGQVVMGSADTVALPPVGREVIGKFRLNDRGFGFIIPDTRNSSGDLFIPAGRTGGALTGDRVRAEVHYDKRRRGGSISGTIVEILTRGNTVFVGQLTRQGKLWVVHVDGKILNDPVIVRDPSAKNAREGSKVVIELTRYPENNMTAEGVILEVIGEQGDPSAETLGIMRAYNLNEEYPKPAVDAARQIVRDYEGKNQSKYFADRLDLREHFILTIDPPDARDFDDAISIKRTDAGYELGVHIADVATFVIPGSDLDDEAHKRGNSVYLPRVVIPMLPEILSNGICSLQEAVPRLTKSAFIRYDRNGKVLGHRFANSVIRSNKRLTYLEAQALIDGDRKEAAKHAATEGQYSDQLIEQLREMDQLSKIIRKRRLAQGMIVLDLPEVELLYDDLGHVIDAQPEDDAYTHKLIEAFMVEANEAVAQLFSDLGVPLIRRTHPDPGSADVNELRRFARVAGYNIPANPSRKELQSLIDAVRGKPAARAVHLAVLKTLTKAEYAPALVGHFALASEHYTHFTSPIRRYPDLAVHRQLQALFEIVGQDARLPQSPAQRKKLARQLEADPRCPDFAQLTALGRHCSTTERNAEAAERELRDILVLQLMAKHVGESFTGTVTGVMGFGIFVQIDKYLVEGLIRNTDLPGAPAERWAINEATGSVTAQRSGRSITIGDQFTVRVNKVDIARREMDLQIVDDKSKPARRPTPGKAKKPAKTTGKTRKMKHTGRKSRRR